MLIASSFYLYMNSGLASSPFLSIHSFISLDILFRFTPSVSPSPSPSLPLTAHPAFITPFLLSPLSLGLLPLFVSPLIFSLSHILPFPPLSLFPFPLLLPLPPSHSHELSSSPSLSISPPFYSAVLFNCTARSQSSKNSWPDPEHDPVITLSIWELNLP